MLVNGNSIRSAIKRWRMRKEAADGQFIGSLNAFDGEEKQFPETLAEEYLVAGFAVTKLRAVQQLFNQRVKLELDRKYLPGQGQITLAEAVGMVGTLAAVEKMWKDAISSGDRDPWSRNRRTASSRSKDNEYSERSVSVEFCVKKAADISKKVDHLREAIGSANSTKIEIEDLSDSLFE